MMFHPAIPQPAQESRSRDLAVGSLPANKARKVSKLEQPTPVGGVQHSLSQISRWPPKVAVPSSQALQLNPSSLSRGNPSGDRTAFSPVIQRMREGEVAKLTAKEHEVKTTHLPENRNHLAIQKGGKTSLNWYVDHNEPGQKGLIVHAHVPDTGDAKSINVRWRGEPELDSDNNTGGSVSQPAPDWIARQVRRNPGYIEAHARHRGEDPKTALAEFQAKENERKAKEKAQEGNRKDFFAKLKSKKAPPAQAPPAPSAADVLHPGIDLLHQALAGEAHPGVDLLERALAPGGKS